jgi:hypothetical protein
MNSNEIIRLIRNMPELAGRNTVTSEEIYSAVEKVFSWGYPITDSKEFIIKRLEEIFTISQSLWKSIIKEEENNPWLKDKRTSIDFSNGFWGNYKQYLEEEKNYAPDVINKLDLLTDEILDNLFDPSIKRKINKKGLVVGQVQSGKTGNYTGLICKAADAGFRLIIVLAGIHNNLRSQTQLRIDESFLGFDTKHKRALITKNIRIGVGQPSYRNKKIAHSLTSSEEEGDFNQSVANSLGLNFETSDTLIAVIKKNPGPLKQVYNWLLANAKEDSEFRKVILEKSILVIDDEADNASINTNRKECQPTRINGQIRDILNLFNKSAYVGYTATPFANIFIPLDDENLFPRNFIKNIPAPSNYIGPEKVFGFGALNEDENSELVLPMVNRINDYNDFVPDGHKKDGQLPSFLPESLKRAIRCFIITCAIRRLRGQTRSHNSMLIHISRFQRWQNHLMDRISNQFLDYRNGIDQNDKSTLELFRKTFELDENNYRSYVTVSKIILGSELAKIDSQIQIHEWPQVLEHLNDAVQVIKVRAIHGGSGEALDYYDHKNGLSVIAVGGNKLSRGLTLEGLSVSYYLRASRMYDTLMQMGRWFGYRGGYVDLCRLFTSRELNEWFCHITLASEELREEFDYMADVAGSTPEQYALKIRTSPDGLMISAINKMRNATTVQISWAGRIVESYEFKKDVSVINRNFTNAQNFIATLPSSFIPKSNAFLWYDIPAEQIINFFEGLESVDELKKSHPEKLINFIKSQQKNKELTNWRVALMSKPNAKSSIFKVNGNELVVGQWIRRDDDESQRSNEEIYILRKSRIISPWDEFIDLTEDEKRIALEMTNLKSGKSEGAMYPKGQIVRNELRDPKNPLLLIYLLDPKESLKKYPLPPDTNPFIGYAISFPKSKFNAPISYAVNEELLPQFNQGQDNNEDEDYEDDEN